MTDSFDEAVKTLRVKFYYDGVEDAAAYLRENFIPRSRVEKMFQYHADHVTRGFPDSPVYADHCSKRNVLADLLSEERT